MVNRKGAPEKNQYAYKGGKGAGVTTYLSLAEIAALKRLARDRGGNENDWRKKAHELAKAGIYGAIREYMEPDIL